MMAFSGKGSGHVDLAVPWTLSLLVGTTRAEEKKEKLSCSMHLDALIHERQDGSIVGPELFTRLPSNFLFATSAPWFSLQTGEIESRIYL